MRVAPSFVTAGLALTLSRAVLGSLYVINPLETTVCHGGQPCPVQWLDDGEQPLLTTMGPCHVSLYAENEILIQQIEPVDVSTTHSLTFTPSPNAAPNSNSFYIQFTSVDSPDPSRPLTAFSSNFSLDQMTGSFQNPVPELTSSIPVPASVLTAHPNPVSTTLLSGTISLSVSPTLSSPSSSLPLSSSSSSLPLSSRPASTSPSIISSSSKSSNGAAQHTLQLSVATLIGLSMWFLV